MLETLGVQLCGQVLRHLPPADLRSARQAARIFDQASREHLERSETMKLRSCNAGGAHGGPDWARFPRLRRLELQSWEQQRAEALRALFARGGAGLSSLREVDCLCCPLDAMLWAAILKHAPAVTSITGQYMRAAQPGDACLAVIATIGSLAPQLSQFEDGTNSQFSEQAGIIARAMPNLRSLKLWRLTDSSADEEALASVMGAPPFSQLTSLAFEDGSSVLPLVRESACWPQLRQLCGISLPGERAAALANGLPSLEFLGAAPEGEWAGAPQAVFGRVRQARLGPCCESFTAHARISSLMPSLERLTLYDEGGIVTTDPAGGTRLTHLVLGSNDTDVFCELQPRAWAALSTMSHLRRLALDVTAAEMPRLASLPAALEVLRVNVAHGLYEDGEVQWFPEDTRDAFDLCGVLEAAARLPLLRTLMVHASGLQVHHGALAGLVGARLGALEELEVECSDLQLHDVALLAAPRWLRRLHVWRVGGCPEAFAKLAAQHASRGLQLESGCSCNNTFSRDFEEGWPW